MTVILYILAYIAVGSLVSFTVKLIGYKQKWEEDNRKAVSSLAWAFWPIFCVVFTPVMTLQKLSAALDRKARELSRK